MTKYCLGQIVKSKKEFLDLVEKSREEYDLIELWVDFIEDFSINFLNEVCDSLKEKLIVLLRRNDGKEIRLSMGDRKAIVELLASKKSLLDLDVNEQSEEIQFYEGLNKKPFLIASYHDYKETPDFLEIENIIKNMRRISPDIYKFACFCNTIEEAGRVISVYSENTDLHGKLIMLGGGPNGTLTRVGALLWNQPIIYAPREVENFVIAGQLTLEQYKNLEKTLIPTENE